MVRRIISTTCLALMAMTVSACSQPAGSPSGAEMVVIPAASFEMGETIDYGYGEIDGPRHTVDIQRSFALAKTEVTVGEFRQFVEATGHLSEGKCNIYTDEKSWHIDPDRNWEHPGFVQAEDHPVVCVSWEDTQAYASWLTQQTGEAYRLPSEAEWEYVATFGDIEGEDGVVGHDEANIGLVDCCGGKAEGRDVWIETAPVGSFPSDKFGIHDMRGNVWEWQADCHQDNYVGAPVDGSARTECDTPDKRSIRGGSYGDAGDYLSPRYRLPGPKDQGYFTVGFRLAHDVREPQR
ncbi:MAG: 3-oxoalanine-generating protein [Hyphomonas sp.]|uniref:Formylglycine-generating enzyme family protein n=3 Tax=Hyphomonadaceae TaxID=69657 RepID=A0A356W7H0_9PROT|nr:3-oxoalanine-generating protein [Hyphomonas sp.]OUX86790.1 MAG: hypothetical protein CBB91_07275 [Hyphomonas sp. TMED31]HAE94509.1 formylglycine-generating enzyme family protein [Hyphomonas atlantica]HBQ49283.1 formylglycine-generating enzyme family protein [Hyphomonas atlantica]